VQTSHDGIAQAFIIIEFKPMNKAVLTGQIVELLSVYPEVRIAILFGSMASATNTPESDLDLALYGERRLSSELTMNLIQQLASIAKCPIDLIDMRVVGEPILGDILTKGERILGSDTDFALLLSRYLIDKADFYPYRERLLQERQERWIRD
jgi:predicted nucleotidyltransferase